jgi:hypothetical protein
MSEQEQEPGEQTEREETVEDLEAPEEQAADVAGGLREQKEVDAQ